MGFRRDLIRASMRREQFLFYRLRTISTLRRIFYLLNFCLSTRRFSMIVRLTSVRNTSVRRRTRVNFTSLINVRRSLIRLYRLLILYHGLLSIFLRAIFLFNVRRYGGRSSNWSSTNASRPGLRSNAKAFYDLLITYDGR